MTNFLYNPDRKSKEQLIAEFVVRTDVFDDIMHDLESSSMKTPEQNYLIVGQRGTGKTTLLNRLKYGVEDSQKLKGWLIPVIFSEEQYNITELGNLWENVAHILEDYHGFSGISAQMEANITKKNFEELCYEILERSLKKKEKKLILFIDNIGDLLKKLDEVEVRRMREILQTKSYLRVIAGSPFYLDSILDYKQPFFEFFKIKRLEGLNKNEAEQLLLKLGDVFDEKQKIEAIIKDSPERIETLRVLSGGVPRTIALMFRIFMDHEHENSLKDLERVLDAVTPLYKHRMDDLPTQQQKIVDAVARNWDAISVKELRERVRLDGKIISAQLRQLEKNQIVEKRETGTKNHFYLLKERFWNIWYLMRYGRKGDSERVVWLVRFLEEWCSESEFEKRIYTYIEQINTGNLTKENTSFYGQVYASIKKLKPKLKLLLRDAVPQDISCKININEEEVISLSSEFAANKNFSSAILEFCKLNILSENGKDILLKLLDDFRKFGYEAFREFMIDEISKIVGEDDDDTEEVTLTGGQNFLLLYSIFEGLRLTILSEKLGNDDDDLIGTFISFINKYQHTEIGKAELGLVFLTIVYLLLKGYYNNCTRLFGEVNSIDLKNRTKPLYYVTIYFLHGPESDEFKKMGNEIKEIVMSLISKINVAKAKAKKLLSL